MEPPLVTAQVGDWLMIWGAPNNPKRGASSGLGMCSVVGEGAGVGME